MMKLTRIFFTSFLVIVCLLSISPIHVFAHAYLQHSNPKDQSQLQIAPKQVRLIFDEMIQSDFPSIQVTNSNGKKVSTGKTRINKENNHVVEVHLQKKLPADIYTAHWRVVSADGHPVEGQIAFKVGKTKQSFQQASKVNNTSQTVFSSLQKIVLYIGFSIFTGALVFSYWIFKRREVMPVQVNKVSERLRFIGWLIIGIAILSNIPLQLITIAGNFQLSSAREIILHNTTGHLLVIQVVVWLLLGVLFCFKKQQRNYVILSGEMCLLLLLFITKASMGHSAAATDEVVAIAANVLHLACASVWVGTMAVMAVALWKYPAKKEKWQRFSLVGVVSVAGILMSGLLLAVMDLGAISHLFTTKYGLLLLVKLFLFLLMAGIGLAHYFIIHVAKKAVPLKTIVAEYILGIAVLLVAGFLTNTPTPPRESPASFNQTIVAEKNQTKINLQITPKVVGENQFIISFLKQDGTSQTNFQQVSLTAINENTKHQVTFHAVRKKKLYTARGLYLNQTGNWKVNVHGLTKNFQNVDQTFHFSITQ